MTKKFKVPTWDELRELVNSGDPELEIDYFLRQECPKGLREPMALALSVAKWSPENTDNDMGKWTTCGLCHTYFLDLSCKGCPLETVGQGCVHSEESAYHTWLFSQGQDARTRMFAILVDLYRQAYDAYPKKPKYKKPEVK
jgi:hypothetical protein